MTLTRYKLNLIGLIFAISLVLLCAGGCIEKEQPLILNKSGTSLSSSGGMIDYLSGLPAVEDVRNWHNSHGQGVVITTKHYEVYTTLMDPLMLRQVPAFMEAAHRAYQQQLPNPIQVQTRSTVYLFKNRQQWEQFTKEFTGTNWRMYLKITKGAYYLNGACVSYNIGRSATFSVLAHEGWHQFNSRHFAYRLPSWLDEGIATLFEKSKYINGNFVFEPALNGGRLGALKQSIISGKMLGLKDLIALNPGEVVHDSGATVAFYGQSYGLVRFLREDGYGKRLGRYHNLLGGALRGDWAIDSRLSEIAANRNVPITAGFNRYVSTKLFKLYISEDIDRLEKEYRAYCNKIVYNVRLK